MELFQLLGTIAINNAMANREIDETAEKAEQSEGRMGKAFKKVGVAALALGATATAAVTKMAVSNYADYEQLVGGVETLFKKSSGKVIQYADNAYQTAGLSANEYMETVTSFSASLLQGLGGDTAKAADIANMGITDMADNANKMGTSMQSIQDAYQGFAKQNYTMLDNLKLGYGGTQEEMIRLINDSGILNEKISSLDNVSFDQIIQAIHEVQNNIGITGTTAKEASTTIQGSLAAMKSAWTNLLIGIAAGNQDTGKLFANLFESAQTAASNLVPRIGITLKGLFSLLRELAPQMMKGLQDGITNGLPKLMQSGADMIEKIGTGLKNNIPTLISRGLDILLNLSSTLKQNAPQLIQAGLNMIVNLAKGLMDSLPALISKVPTIVSNIANIINQNAPKLITTALRLIKTLALGLVQAIPTLVANIPKIIKAIVDVFLAYNWLKLGKNVITFFKNGITSMVNGVKSAGKKIFDTVVNAIKALPKKLLDLAKSAVSKLVSILRHTASVKSAASAIKNEIVRVLVKLPSKMIEIGRNLVKGLWNGIVNVKDWIISKVKGFGKGILDGLKDFFGIHSPSKVMETMIGKNLALGVINGLSKKKKAVLNASKKHLGESIADGLVSGIENAKANAKKKSSEISNLIIKEAKNRLEKGRTYKKMNLVDEVEYWDAVRKQCKKGTKAKLEADKQYLAAKKKLAAEQKKVEKQLVEDAEKRLDKYKTYNNMSLKDETEYWDKIRKAARTGTEARLEADKKYFEAKENYNAQLIQAEKDYSDAVEAANQKIEDRTKSILSAFNLFDEFKLKIDEENPITSDTLMNNLQSQVDALEEWGNNINDLEGKIGDTELFKAIQEMGVSSLQQVKAINAMTEEQMAKYVELYNQRQQQAKDQATAELGGEVLDDINAAMDTYQKTLESLDTSTKKKYTNIAKTIKNKTTEAATVTVERLQTMLNSFTTGTKGMADTTKTKFDSILTKIQSNMKSAVATVQSAVAQMQAALASVGAAETETTVTAKANVSKHAKGGILTEPTIFGYSPRSNTYHLGGEAGAEAIAPIDVLQGYVRDAVASETAEQVSLLKRMNMLLEAILDKDTAVYLNSKEISKAVNRDLGVIL